LPGAWLDLIGLFGGRLKPGGALGHTLFKFCVQAVNRILGVFPLGDVVDMTLNQLSAARLKYIAREFYYDFAAIEGL